MSKKNRKTKTITIGMIASEAYWGPIGTGEAEYSQDGELDWERAAQAVRAAVIEECAKIADGELDIGNTVSAAIRALKDRR